MVIIIKIIQTKGRRKEERNTIMKVRNKEKNIQILQKKRNSWKHKRMKQMKKRNSAVNSKYTYIKNPRKQRKLEKSRDRGTNKHKNNNSHNQTSLHSLNFPLRAARLQRRRRLWTYLARPNATRTTLRARKQTGAGEGAVEVDRAAADPGTDPQAAMPTPEPPAAGRVSGTAISGRTRWWLRPPAA